MCPQPTLERRNEPEMHGSLNLILIMLFQVFGFLNKHGSRFNATLRTEVPEDATTSQNLLGHWVRRVAEE